MAKKRLNIFVKQLHFGVLLRLLSGTFIRPARRGLALPARGGVFQPDKLREKVTGNLADSQIHFKNLSFRKGLFKIEEEIAFAAIISMSISKSKLRNHKNPTKINSYVPKAK